MAELNGNPFLLEEAALDPTPEEYDPPPAEEPMDLECSNGSIEPMQLERGIDFAAHDWAYVTIPSIGQVDPSTISQLVSGC